MLSFAKFRNQLQIVHKEIITVFFLGENLIINVIFVILKESFFWAQYCTTRGLTIMISVTADVVSRFRCSNLTRRRLDSQIVPAWITCHQEMDIRTLLLDIFLCCIDVSLAVSMIEPFSCSMILRIFRTILWQ